MIINVQGHNIEVNEEIIARFSKYTSAPIERHAELFFKKRL